MNVSSILTKDYENKTAFRLEQNKPNQSQFQTRSEFIPKGADITTGELLGILKPGTNCKRVLQKKLVFHALVFYKMQQTGQAITNWQLQIGNRKFNASEAVFDAGSVGTI